MTGTDWISTKEAAALLGYSEDYFRRTFCAEGAPLVTIRVWHGPRGGRRIVVLRVAVEALVEEQIQRPA